MRYHTSKSISMSVIVVIFALAMQVWGLPARPALADDPTPANTMAPQKRPFQLPFADPSGPDTWLMAQPYGSTTGAYRQRFTTYGASGGIHFGVDLSAPCGTPIVAIADGVVFAVDGPFGSPPHNLMIDHPQLGYASMYGHLLEAPDLTPGQTVKQGQVIAKVGDSRETCYSRPHLHLEIRDLKHVRKYNPLLFIEANWDDLTLTGTGGRAFARDLTQPRKWQSIYDQPEVWTGGPIVNDFADPWPLDWEKGGAPTAAKPTNKVVVTLIQTETLTSSTTSPVGRQITGGDCCTQPYWNADSTQVRFIDRPTPDLPAGIWGIDVTQPQPEAELITDWLGVYSPDGTLIAYPNKSGLTVIERLADGQTWEIDTQERRVNFTPDSRQILWVTYDEDAPRDTRTETIWLANVDGSNSRVVLSAPRTNAVAWLPNDRLLLARRVAGSSDEELFMHSLASGRETKLLRLPEMRGLELSPDRRYLVYYVQFEPQTKENGIWLLDLENSKPSPQKLPFFGTYRWRDDNHLIYVPFDPDVTEHQFFEYSVDTSQTRDLFPGGTNLTIANNDWQVSPDGRHIALVRANGTSLDGIWVLDIPAN